MVTIPHCLKVTQGKLMLLLLMDYVRTNTRVQSREAIEDFTGGVSTQTHTRDIIDRDRFWKDQLGNINQKYLFTVRKKPYADFQGTSVGATPIIRIFEGFGVRLVLLRYTAF